MEDPSACLHEFEEGVEEPEQAHHHSNLWWESRVLEFPGGIVQFVNKLSGAVVPTAKV